MLEIKKYEAKTKEDALDNALKELKLTKEDLFLKSEFIEGKLFKSPKYIVSVLKKQDVIDFIADFIKNIAIYMNLNIETEIIESEEVFNVLLVSNNNSILIGKEGKNLNALQTLIRQMIKNQTGLLIKLNLDVSNYKVKKLKKIEQLVRGIAKDVEDTQMSVSLDSMNSYKRRLLHKNIYEKE